MELLASLLDLFLHLDRHLAALAVQHGLWIYAILFVVIFAETGLVVTPLLKSPCSEGRQFFRSTPSSDNVLPELRKGI